MVQRKAPDKPKSTIEHKKTSHGGLERQLSSHLPQDKRTRGGVDLKKKLKKVKSIKISDFDSLELSPMDIQFKNISPCKKRSSSTPIRNYMKPTTSSDARKEKLHVTVTSPSTSSHDKKKGSMKKCSVVGLCSKKNVNRSTCSSTLKDSKFPAALELNHGATEVEGTSKIRVCPYTYCSLNGHMHQELPPVKCFISARRNLLKTQRSLKVKRLLSFKTSLLLLEKKGEMIDDDDDDELEDEIGENSSDLFIEIYTMPQVGKNNCDEISILEEKYHEQCILDEVEYSMETETQMNDSSDISFGYDYDMDQKSEFSQDEMDDVMSNFLEHVEFDHERTTAAQKDCEEDGEINEYELETMNMNWEEEICLFPDNTDISNSPDEQLSVITTDSHATSEDAEVDSQSEEDKEDSDISELISQSIDHEVQKLSSEMMNCQSDESSLGDDSKNLDRELQEASNGTDTNILNVASIEYKEMDSILNSRWDITKKRTTEEFEQVKDFNPRPPNFLPSEPDPEAEKVDLRHQIMDERRNSEEWMLDYALQQAVTKLGPARKKKVALLVQAFETVIPLPMWEKPQSHGTSTFTHLSFIQACN